MNKNLKWFSDLINWCHWCPSWRCSASSIILQSWIREMVPPNDFFLSLHTQVSVAGIQPFSSIRSTLTVHLFPLCKKKRSLLYNKMSTLSLQNTKTLYSSFKMCFIDFYFPVRWLKSHGQESRVCWLQGARRRIDEVPDEHIFWRSSENALTTTKRRSKKQRIRLEIMSCGEEHSI